MKCLLVVACVGHVTDAFLRPAASVVAPTEMRAARTLFDKIWDDHLVAAEDETGAAAGVLLEMRGQDGPAVPTPCKAMSATHGHT